MFFCLHTSLACAVKGELVAFYLEPILLPDCAVQAGIHCDLVEIDDRAAGGANEMTVRGDDGVKPLLSLDDTHALNGALPLKEQQVPVYGAQAQVRVGRLQGLVDPLSGGVRVRAADGVQDGFPLLAVPSRALHWATS